VVASSRGSLSPDRGCSDPRSLLPPDGPPQPSHQITELATHDWDLAKATGQVPAELDPALAEHALRWSRGMLRPEFRGPGKAFGVEVPVAEDAPVYDRLAGWFGRDPGWERVTE